jgi:inositol-phosphate phosphatase/L-galactose 1-phosphate phosphatase/histidinol-phosphatase
MPRVKIKVIDFVLADIENELILIQKRSSNRELYPGMWELPGGKCEKNETEIECLMRELHEETGLHLTTIHKKIHEFIWSDDPDVYNAIYLVEAYGGTFIPELEKISEYRWVSKSEIERLRDTNKSSIELWNGALKAFSYVSNIKDDRIGSFDTLHADHIGLALDMSVTARKIALKYFRNNTDIQSKVDGSPVTLADTEIEAMMKDKLNHFFPGHGVIGEETGSKGLSCDYVWLLDPIDGTKAFITGKPLFGILIALLYKGKPILGIIDQPFIGERWVGALSMPTTYNGQIKKVAVDKPLSEMFMYTANPEMHEGKYKVGFQQLCRSVKLVQYNADCYAYGLLSMGQVDLVIEQHLKPYDVMGLIPIVEGSGGYICNWKGETITLDNFDGTLIAGSSKERVLEALEILCKGYT